MTDEIVIVAVADPHLGRDAFYCSPEEWDSPVLEALAYAKANDAYFLIAGDIFNYRSPTPAQYRRAEPLFLYPKTIGVLGNHDFGASLGSVPATWPWLKGRWRAMEWQAVVGPPVQTVRAPGPIDGDLLQIIALPWPRPVDYLTREEISAYDLARQIALTRDRVMEALRREVAALDPARPAVLLGHAMVAMGHVFLGDAPMRDPGLQLGKDVVLSHNEILGATSNLQAVYLGHVHRRMGPYVGSTQPTDWGEADDVKAFTVTRLTKVAHFDSRVHRESWTAEHETGPYKSSRRLTVVNWAAGVLDVQPQEVGGFDVVRVEAAVREGEHFDAAAIRKALEMQGTIVESVSATVIGERKRRVENVDGLDLTQPAVAAAAWTQQRGLDERLAAAVVEEISSLDDAALEAARG